MLKQRDDFNWGLLAKRLRKFYYKWADGDFIEQITETLPQWKAGRLKEQGIKKGQRQVDIYTGLNIMILLLELHRYGKTLEDDSLKTQLSFHPCGVEEIENWDETRLLKIIDYSNFIDISSFKVLLRQFFSSTNFNSAYFGSADLTHIDFSYTNFSNANLSGADLIHANFSGADLSGADLSRTQLCSANLQDANLQDAYLHSADLEFTKLIDAKLYATDFTNAKLYATDFIGADLRNASFHGADLRNADLRNADLRNANLSYADLRNAQLFQVNLNNIRWDNTTLWDRAYHLHTAFNIPDDLAEDLSFRAAVSLSQGYDLAQAGEIEAALQAYQKAQEINPSLFIDIPFWQQLCWHGCLHDKAEQVLFAGEKAVELLRDRVKTSCLESRGLARALTNNLIGALEDFKAIQPGFIDLIIVNDCRERMEPEAEQQRQKWITALEAGINPFTPEELEALRQAEKEYRA